ncbi:melanoma-associated antigen B4-like [Arvicanthis niloticus]|uniref:melanoma-associated antigen B4-like n=1 Tax=Arvicanthis niloticus TaxID=61156 RepID=UPI0014871D38|nr:melanoma-associated antigen B4-like [Arvicanthis niloticus]
MPRGHNSKLRARKKRRQARSETHSMQDAQASTAAEEREETPSFSPLCSADVQHSSVTDSPGKSKYSQQPTTASVSALSIKSDEDKESQDDEIPSTSWAPSPSPTANLSSAMKDDIAVSLVEFMLQKYNRREPITREEILKCFFPLNKEDFHEILKKASELMVLAYGIDVKEIDPINHRYVFVNILSPNGDEILNGETIQSRNGLLMLMLCLIFMNGNCVNEDYIWEVLSVMGVYAGVNHTIYGNVKKLITKDFVNEGYLEYRQVPINGIPCHQFLWGPRARYETSKMRFLEFLAKVHNTVPTAFPSLYQEALRAEEERIQGRFVAMILSLMANDHLNGNSSI